VKDIPRMTQMSRRHVLALSVGALSAPLVRGARASEVAAEAHGISAFGDLKYPVDFPHFGYVNVDAPKGGAFSLIPSVRAYNQSYFTFSSLNAYILKGEGAQGMDMTFAPLMARANDEPDAMYGLAAKSVRISPDKLTYTFTMRPEARFHDGSRLTAHDVAFSLNTLKEKGHPLVVVQLRDFVKADALDDATVAVTFAPNRARDVAGLRPVQGRQVRGQPLHRIRARQGLVGCRPAGLPRQLQFRHGALRVLPRSRRRLRRFHRQELSVPRGAHVAHLGHALRFSGGEGRSRQARAAAG
jgi:hypothetical protein